MIFLGLMLLFSLILLGLHIHGIILGFKQHPLYGLLCLLFGPFAIIVSLTKLITDTNLLAKK